MNVLSLERTKLEDIKFDNITEFNEDKFLNGLKFFDTIKLSLSDYYIALTEENRKTVFIDTNDKCNRLDVEDEEKKQGIISCILKNAPFCDFSLIWQKDPLTENWYLTVNDGGHRSRSILEFMNDEFRTGPNCFALNSLGKEIDLGSMTYSEIKKRYPNIIKQFLNYPLLLTLNWNMTAKDKFQDFDDRNKTTDVKPAELRNALDENVIASLVRSSVKEVFWREDKEIYNFQISVHKLFSKEVIGFENKRMVYDEIFSKILNICWAGTCKIDHGHDALRELYADGSQMAGDNGKFVTNPKLLKTVNKKARTVCDFLFGVLSNWETNKSAGLVWSLVRFYIEYEKRLSNEFQTFVYNDKIKINYKKFANSWLKLYEKLDKEETTGTWVPKQLKKRMKGEAFTGYLGDFSNLDKIQKCLDWIFEEFDKMSPKEDYGETFGITVYDSRTSFTPEQKKKKWLELNEKDEFGNEIQFEDIQGDHDIPRSYGVKKGGVTEESNLAILHIDDNQEKSDKMTLKEYKEYKK